MALAALIAACRQLDDGNEGLCATLPVAGRTLVEHQVRLAAAAGARHIVILVERVTAPLAAAIDRLRGDGIAIEVARSVATAADSIHPAETLLLFADGCIAGAELVERMAATAAPAVMTVPDAADPRSFERIDAQDRWAGLALIEGERLRETAAMLGDWDLQSTLLRHAIQQGAERVPAFADGGVGSGQDILVVASDAAALAGVDERLVNAARRRGRDWPARYIFPLIEVLVAGPLVRSRVQPGWLAGAGVASAGLAIAAILAGGWSVGLILLMASGPLGFVATRLAAARLGLVRHERRLKAARDLGAGLALGALASGLAKDGSWGHIAVAALIVVAMLAALPLKRARTTLALPPPGPAYASVDGLIWALPPFVVGSWWGVGLGALALYAATSLLFLGHRTVPPTNDEA